MSQSGSDKAAIAWVIAKNKEQNSSFENQKKAYCEGIIDGKNPDDEIIEDFQGQIPPGGIILTLDRNGDGCDASGDFITNLQKGFWLKQTPDNDPNANTCHIYYYPLKSELGIMKSVGTLYCDEYGPTGELLRELHYQGAYYPGGHKFFRTWDNQPALSYKAVNLTLIPSETRLFSNTVNGNGDPYYELNWVHNDWLRGYISAAQYISTTPLVEIDI